MIFKQVHMWNHIPKITCEHHMWTSYTETSHVNITCEHHIQKHHMWTSVKFTCEIIFRTSYVNIMCGISKKIYSIMTTFKSHHHMWTSYVSFTYYCHKWTSHVKFIYQKSHVNITCEHHIQKNHMWTSVKFTHEITWCIFSHVNITCGFSKPKILSPWITTSHIITCEHHMWMSPIIFIHEHHTWYSYKKNHMWTSHVNITGLKLTCEHQIISHVNLICEHRL